jgi:hypothetical protein
LTPIFNCDSDCICGLPLLNSKSWRATSKSCATLSSFWAQTVPSWFLARVGLCVRRSACVAADPSECDSDTEPDTPSSRLPSSARSWSSCRNSIRWEHRTVASRTRQPLLHGFVQVVRTALLSQVSRSQHSGKQKTCNYFLFLLMSAARLSPCCSALRPRCGWLDQSIAAHEHGGPLSWHQG